MDPMSRSGVSVPLMVVSLLAGGCGTSKPPSGEVKPEGGHPSAPTDGPADHPDAAAGTAPEARYNTPDEGVDSVCPTWTPPQPLPDGTLTEQEAWVDVSRFACNDPWSWCGAGACGNGKVDSCQVAIEGRCGERKIESVTEVCDGTSLNGETCQSLGYSGGTLKCSSLCGFDVTGCSTCAAAGAGSAIARCAAPPLTITGNPYMVALATGASGLAMAWTSYRGDGTLSVGFARLDQSLGVVSQVAEVSGASEPNNRGARVGLAALTDGWELLVEREHDSKLMRLDADGQPTGAAVVLPDARGLGAVEQPGGSPLILWSVSGPLTKAALLSADGKSTTTPITLFAAPFGDRGAAFVGDGFLVAERTLEGIAMARVEPDGTSKAGARLIFQPDVFEFPRLSTSGGVTRLFYAPFPGSLQERSVDVDRNGALIGTPVSISADQSYENALLFEQGGALLRAGKSGVEQFSPHLELLRVDAAGHEARPPVRVATDPRGARGYTMVRWGQDAAIAWIGGGCPGNITVARVAP
jgi:hypothetical protein